MSFVEDAPLCGSCTQRQEAKLEMKIVEPAYVSLRIKFSSFFSLFFFVVVQPEPLIMKTKKYDFLLAKKLILEYGASENVSASLGMAEDWDFTSLTVFANGAFLEDLSTCVDIMGADRSWWATPTLEIAFTDGKTKRISCFLEVPHERH